MAGMWCQQHSQLHSQNPLPELPENWASSTLQLQECIGHPDSSKLEAYSAIKPHRLALIGSSTARKIQFSGLEGLPLWPGGVEDFSTIMPNAGAGSTILEVPWPKDLLTACIMKLHVNWQSSHSNFLKAASSLPTKGTANADAYETDSTEQIRFRHSNVKYFVCVGLTSPCF